MVTSDMLKNIYYAFVFTCSYTFMYYVWYIYRYVTVELRKQVVTTVYYKTESLGVRGVEHKVATMAVNTKPDK